MAEFIECPVGCGYRCSGCAICGAPANHYNSTCKECMECLEATQKFFKIIMEVNK
jgi:hypothetical protein